MSGSLHVGKIAGISIDINWSWLIILALLTVSLATGWFPVIYPRWPIAAYWGIALTAAILLFLSVLVHELAHSLMANALGVGVKSITLFIFGGVSDIEREPPSASTEFWITIVGPATSFVIGAISFVVGAILLQVNVYAAAIFSYLGIANLLLGVFNLLPGFPLDGGRVLRSIIWGITGNLQKATRWASRIGEVVAVSFILLGIFEMFFLANFLGGIWIAFIGWFLWQSARIANTQVMLQALLKDATVADVMSRDAVTVSGDITVRQFVDDYVLRRGVRSAMVVDDGKLRGLITLADLRQLPQQRWDRDLVAQAMVPLQRLHAVTPTESLNEVLPLMARYEVNQVPVVQDGQIVGVVTREHLMRYIEIRRELGSRSITSRPPQAPDQTQTPTSLPQRQEPTTEPSGERPLAGAS
jgi:Zn-dependent protease/CBS domain-containing protein